MTLTLQLDRTPAKQIVLEKITIFLGANGSGKSKLLRDIKQKISSSISNQNLIYVEGGRVILLPESLIEHSGPPHRSDTLEHAEINYTEKKPQALSSRIHAALTLLEKKDQLSRDKHSDLIHEWQENGEKDATPVREQLKLDKLKNLFNEIFPQIILSFDLRSKKISCSKNNGDSYSPNQLSDGEKQVLSLITDISILGEPNSIIIVDEPELNLNSLLAIRLWNSLEQELLDSTFLYATHDISFCLRENVEKIYVLSDQNNLINEIDNVANIEANELRAFLGSIPAILSTNSAIITEGKADSIDSIFYRWIVGSNTIEIVAMGSASDVVAVSSRQGIWEVVAPMVRIVGIIDRDYKSDDTLSKLRSEKTLVLKFHEVESHLCLPEVVICVAMNIGLVEKLPTKDEIEILIIEEFKKNKLKIAAQRVFQKTNLHVSISIQRQLLSRMETAEEIENELINEAKKQTDFVTEQFDRGTISKSLGEELALCEKYIVEKDIEKILALTPGKSLLQKIFPLTGARNALDFARACSKQIKVEDIPELAELKELISRI